MTHLRCVWLKGRINHYITIHKLLQIAPLQTSKHLSKADPLYPEATPRQTKQSYHINNQIDIHIVPCWGIFQVQQERNVVWVFRSFMHWTFYYLNFYIQLNFKYFGFKLVLFTLLEKYNQGRIKTFSGPWKIDIIGHYCWHFWYENMS